MVENGIGGRALDQGNLAVDDIPALVRVEHVNEPDATNHATYERLLETFVSVHAALKPVIRR